MPADQWRHCLGKSNPADIPSRGLTPLELAHHTWWFKGPDWLADTESKEGQILQMPDECIPESRAKDCKVACDVSFVAVAGKTETSQFMDLEKYSDLLYVTANSLKGSGRNSKLRPCYN